MATNQALCNHADEDYIDMEVSSTSSILCFSISSPPQAREFEFQMTSLSHEKETTTSPADELFYKGKLLPLHLPPRLQMVQKILQNCNTTTLDRTQVAFEENYSIPFITTSISTTPSTNTSTPIESCNISPSESRRVSTQLNPDECFFEWSIGSRRFIDNDHPKRSWSKKLEQIKQFSLGQKLKASRAYLMSLFSKSGCSDESCAKAACNVEAEFVTKSKDSLNKYTKVAKKNPFGKIDNEKYQLSTTSMRSIHRDIVEDSFNNHRRSFSGVIQRHSATKSSSSSTSSSGSSSFSFSSNGFYDLQLLKRSGSANSEIENSVEEAIAHCKQSQQLFTSTTASEAGVCSLFDSRTAI